MSRFICVVSFLCLLGGCTPHEEKKNGSTCFPMETTPREQLVKVNYIDQNGISETVVHPERLKQFAALPITSPQSYKKLLRIYKKDAQGNAKSIVSSYYDNGQIHQCLACVNSRACGLYCEWHENGQKKMEGLVQAGVADLNEQAAQTWAFHGTTLAWDDHGALVASCEYDQGKMSGQYCTYFPNGALASKSTWKEGLQTEAAYTYDPQGNIRERTRYENGKREGKAEGFYKGQLIFEEKYDNDLLISASYYQTDGKTLSRVTQGFGTRSIFDDGRLSLQHEIHNGKPEGLFTLFDSQGRIERTYFLQGGKKHGIETLFYANPHQKRMTIQWVDDEVHGLVQTWYPNGCMESSKEYCHNQKQGMLTCWYLDGSLMLVEEYQADKLIRGKYHRKGSPSPISVIEKGCGTASLFDSTGNLIDTVLYRDSQPEIKGGSL